jgi:hypothetical protein
MTADVHPEPFHDAMGAGLQRAVQIASCAVTATQVYAYHQKSQAMAAAERNDRARQALTAQIRAERDAARTGWAPALDADWLTQADVYQAARAWSQAMPYADRNVPWYQPSAATAMNRCEERLRDLHPYAMVRYDRLRADGLGPAEAMREAAPLFARAPHARDAHYTPRPQLEPGTAEDVIRTAVVATVPGPEESMGVPGALERRGMQILAALQARARAQQRPPLGEAEQRTVLETITNLPPDVIDRVVQPITASGNSPGASTQPVTGSVATDASVTRTGPDARPWKQDFPVPIQTVIATAAEPSVQGPAAEPRGRGRRRSQNNRPQRRPVPRHRATR